MKKVLIISIISLIVIFYLAYKDINKQEQLVYSKEIQTISTLRNATLIARVLHAEGNGTPDIDKVAIGSSILNRMNSVEFPASIYDVIHQNNQYTISDKYSQHDAMIAVCLLGDYLRDCDILYFFNPKTATNFKDIKKIKKRKLILKTLAHEYY